MKKKGKWINLLGLVIVLCFAATIVPAQMQINSQNRKEFNTARKHSREANKVLSEIMRVPDKAIPRELLDRAHAIAVFPKVKKAAFIVGGRSGNGIVSRRTANGWSTPVFYNIGGASFGAQIGGQSTDYVLLFMNEGALQSLLDENLELGGSLSFAAGPVGRTVAASTSPTLDAGILTWSRSKGAFIGASLNGAAITANNSVNTAVYGMKAGEVLANPERINLSGSPAELRMFTQTMSSYSATSNTGSSN